MSITLSHAMVVVALIASISLVLGNTDRLFPLVAAVVSVLEALIVFGFITLAVAKLRIDVILPALLVLAGGICWSKAQAKSAVTGATALTLVGLVQLFTVLGVLHAR